jgi:hypothetical protein
VVGEAQESGHIITYEMGELDMETAFDFFLPEFRVDPYQFYRRLREEDPIHWGISFEPSVR